MLSGSHVIVYTQDADADREFFRDILKLPPIDAGGGWLIFALPPTEVAFHPADENNTHELYLICENLSATIKELENRGTRFEEPSEQSWGITTQIHLPGGGLLGLYQPLHPTAF
jgi:catechol 2,3-dioxygenase-like lactoylglutathione lyase family enzyme